MPPRDLRARARRGHIGCIQWSWQTSLAKQREVSTHQRVCNGDPVKRLSKTYGCPVELTLDFVGGKWRTVILAWLKEAPHRYGELRKRMPGVADKVLTQRLKE